MIWLWIGLSIILSVFLIRKKKISFENYIWILLPVDMYGLNIAGATIKLYMFFIGILFIILLMRGHNRLILFCGKGRLKILGIFCTATLLVNMLNSGSMSSLKSAVMLILVFFCSIIYLSACNPKSVLQIPDVLIATCVGYGTVFIIGYVFLCIGISVSGVNAAERELSGMFLTFNNMYEGTFIQFARLRGFTIDPNTMIGTFVYGIVVGFHRIFCGKSSMIDYTAAVLSIICILLSNSRTALLCSLLIICLTFLMSYKFMDYKQKKRAWILLISGAGILILVSIGFGLITYIEKNVIALYANRSGLNDEFGRFTIWKEAFSILMEKNPLFGIGLGQMQFYTSIGRACHNTWLEWICSSGLIIGGGMLLYFLSVIVSGMAQFHRFKEKDYHILYGIFSLGNLGVFISLITVDNLTYSYLWFGTAMIIFLSDRISGGH